MALGSVTISRTFIRPPHFEQTVTSTAKTRAKRLDQLSRYGALVQGKSRANPRRWHVGGRTLEVLVQLAVLKAKETPEGRHFETEPILVEDFLTWVERRYGFVIAPGVTPAGRKPVSLDEHRAFRENVVVQRVRQSFHDRLGQRGDPQTVAGARALENLTESRSELLRQCFMLVAGSDGDDGGRGCHGALSSSPRSS